MYLYTVQPEELWLNNGILKRLSAGPTMEISSVN